MQETFGARLRSQRERQEISLRVIAEQTKIRAALLEGLERDDVSHWPGGIFRRSYIRSYAQAIGLDPDAVVREFLQLYPDPTEEDVTTALGARESSRPRTRLGLLLGSALEALPVRRQPAAHPTLFPTAAPVNPDVAGPPPDVQRHANAPHVAPVSAEAPIRHLSSEADVIPVEPVDESRAELEEPARVDAAPMVDPALERLADVCTRIAGAVDGFEVADAVADAAGALGASGLILWAWDSDDDSLSPCLAHGYSQRLLNELPRVRRGDENPVAEAFRTGQTHVVDSDGGTKGAAVVPVINAYGCVGALALELRTRSERDPLVRIMATLLAAQLATLVTPVSRLAAKTA